MKHAWLKITLCWLLAVASTAASSDVSVDKAVLDLRDWHYYSQPIVPLDGRWQFVADRFVTPNEWQEASEDFTLLTVPGSWNDVISDQDIMPGHGFGTYALTIIPPAQYNNLSLHIGALCSNARIYFYPSAEPTPGSVAHIGYPATDGLQAIPSAASTTLPLSFNGNTPHTLLIQMSNYNARFGGLCGQVLLGDSEQLAISRLNHNTFNTFIAGAALIVALYALAVYLQQTGSEDHLWMAIAGTAIAAVFALHSGLLERSTPLNQRWNYELRSTLFMLCIHWASVAGLMIYSWRFPDFLRRSWLSNDVLIATTSSIFIILSPSWLKSSMLPLFLGYWALQIIAVLFVLIRATSANRGNARLMLVSFLPILVTASIDVMHTSMSFNAPTYSGYALIILMIVEAQLQANRFSTALRLSDRLSHHFREEVSLQTAELHRQNQQLEQAQGALQAANSKLKKLSITDGLTEIYNRMFFEQELRKEWRRAQRNNTPVSLLMIDVDHFKAINDTFGHATGDQCLHKLAQVLNDQVKRAGELVARYGGEEFIILLPETDQRKGLAIAEALRVKIANMELSYNGKPVRVTASIGVSTTVPSNQFSPEELLTAADNALYQAKRDGRNRIASAPLLHGSKTDEKNKLSVRPHRHH